MARTEASLSERTIALPHDGHVQELMRRHVTESLASCIRFTAVLLSCRRLAAQELVSTNKNPCVTSNFPAACGCEPKTLTERAWPQCGRTFGMQSAASVNDRHLP